MNETIFDSALRNAYLGRERKHTERKMRRTEECPQLLRFAEGLEKGWLPSERRHISDCEYCQKLMLYAWRRNPPGLWRLVEFVAGTLLDRRAMEMYVEENPTYARLEKSLIVKTLARWVREVKGFTAPNDDFGLAAELARFFATGFSDATVVLTRGSAQSGTLEEDALRRACNYANGVAVASISDRTHERRHELTIDLPDAVLNVNLVVADQRLSITAATSAVGNADRRLLIEVLPNDGAPVAVEMFLKEDRAMQQAIGSNSAHLGHGDIPSEFTLLASWLS